MSESGDEVCWQCTDQTAIGQIGHGHYLMCEECWANKIGRQRFDGVAIHTQRKQKHFLIVEVKRMKDMTEDYWQCVAEIAE